MFTGATTTKVTDQLRSYGVARRKLMLETIHSNDRYPNNWAELPHQPTEGPGQGCAASSRRSRPSAFLGRPTSPRFQ